jgi:hypothetical protein
MFKKISIFFLFLVIGKSQAATTTTEIPNLINAGIIKNWGDEGTKFNFFAESDFFLPKSYKVKIDVFNVPLSLYGTLTVDAKEKHSLKTMQSKGTSFSTYFVIYKKGLYKYDIGIYDPKNRLVGNNQVGNFTVETKNKNPPVLGKLQYDPVLGKSVYVPSPSHFNYCCSLAIGDKFSLSVDAYDLDFNLNSISVDWGDGSLETRNTVGIKSDSVKLQHTYTKLGYFTVEYFATDSSHIPLSSTKISGVVKVVSKEQSQQDAIRDLYRSCLELQKYGIKVTCYNL